MSIEILCIEAITKLKEKTKWKMVDEAGKSIGTLFLILLLHILLQKKMTETY